MIFDIKHKDVTYITAVTEVEYKSEVDYTKAT